MIVPMKKVTLIVQSKDTDKTLRSLKDLGVVHIEHENPPVADNIKKIKGEIAHVAEAITDLFEVDNQTSLVNNEQQQIAEQILDLLQQKELLEEETIKRQRNIDRWGDWGDFDPGLIENFKDKNLLLRLAKIPAKAKKDIPEGIILKDLFKKANFHYCALISRENIKLPFEVLNLPTVSLGSLVKTQETDQLEIADIDKKLLDYAKYKKALIRHREHLDSVLQFNEILAGMGKFNALSYLRGYIPHDCVETLENTAERMSWGILIEEPADNDNVPTLIKNPRWVEMIKPVFNMIKALPGYREVDISLWFLLFFSIFFGILIGDAGYGIVFLVFNFVAQLKLKGKLKDTKIFPLVYVLSISAVVWGVLTGTFFGQAWLPKQVQPLMPFLTKAKNVQALCFLIGAIHLSIAHFWRGVIKFPHLKALAEVGWIAMLWGAFFLAKVLILGEGFPIFAKWLFISGAGLIILFTDPKKNILKGIGLGIGDFLLNIVNSFTDVVSYIRLFAVGSATVAVADAFNQMAMGAGGAGIVGGLITALILLFGHTLNILLGAMAILVHGVRLNVLEFSSHLNMEWAGTQYNPFRKTRG